jgi:hypothetical protein
MTALVLYPLLTAAIFYLLARAMITSWLWSRYPPRLDAFLSCAACAGTWYGAGVALAVGYPLDLPFLGLDGRAWYTPVFVAGCSMIWTPMIAVLHHLATEALGMPAPAGAAATEDTDPRTLSFMPPEQEPLSAQDASDTLNLLRRR